MSTWNVDNYHWEEHNANSWAKDRLNELVNGISHEGWEFKDFTFSTIDATRAIRKGKEIRSYEIVFECTFKYNDMEGKIVFPDISDDCSDSPDDWDTELRFTGKSNDQPAAVKKAVRTPGEKEVIPKFRAAFAQWVKEFKAIPYDLVPTK